MDDTPGINDAQLVQQTLLGDGPAFAALVERYQYAVYGIALSLVSDFDAAEDIAQESFIGAYMHLGDLEEPGRFGNWLRIIALNECRLHLRRSRSGFVPVSRLGGPARLQPEETQPAEQAADAQEQEARQERLEAAALQALDQLSDRNRQVIALHYLGGQSTGEIASFLGTTVSAVKMRLHRARKQLRKEALTMVRNTLTQRGPGPDFRDRIRLVEATALFTDIAGFSRIADAIPARQVIALLNQYLSEMTEIVEQRGGIVDKYEGDAIIASWEGEGHAARACEAVLEMERRLSEWAAQGLPELSVRYGLESGQVLMGDIGSPQLSDETIIGDTVNLAARLETENKRYGTRILIGPGLAASVGDAFTVREVDRIAVPLRAERVTVSELVASADALEGQQAPARARTGPTDPETLRQQVDRMSPASPSADTSGPGWAERINAALAPAVIRRISQSPELLVLDGVEVPLTVFFSDIVGFSKVIRDLPSEQVIGLLRQCHSEMTEIILRFEGTVDKYEGDAIIAFWGAPLPAQDHALRGCLAALDIQARLVELADQWRSDGRPGLRVACGLSTGPAVVGNLGSRQKMDYTAMGRHVNLGARLERLTRDYGVSIMISEHTRAAVGDSVVARELDLVVTIPDHPPLRIYEALARKGELAPDKSRVVQAFLQGLERYREQAWQQAVEAFDEALKLDPQDGPSLVLRGRCASFMAAPPEWLTADWDGALRA